MVVIDGVTVGHPCCGVFNCKIPLDNNHHHFCPTHQPHHEGLCSVVGCEQPAIRSQCTCDKLEHQQVEDIHCLHGQSRFQLQERLERARVSHPNDADARDVADISELLDGHVAEEVFEVDQDGHVCPTILVAQTEGPHTAGKGGNGTGKKKHLHAQFGHRRTFCQEIMVAPCGMIGYRTTYYGAEGVASVAIGLPDSFIAFFYKRTDRCSSSECTHMTMT